MSLARNYRIEVDKREMGEIPSPPEPHPGRKVSFSSGSDDSDWAEIAEGDTPGPDNDSPDNSISPEQREKREEELKSCRVSYTTQWTIDGVSPFTGRTLIPRGKGDTVRNRRRFMQFLKKKGMPVNKSDVEVVEINGRAIIGGRSPASKARVSKSPDYRERKGKT
jgi:hypothetical protein